MRDYISNHIHMDNEEYVMNNNVKQTESQILRQQNLMYL